MMFHASEDFEVSVNPFQSSDIKNSLHWQTQYMWSKVTGTFTLAFTKLTLYSLFKPKNICCGSHLRTAK